MLGKRLNRYQWISLVFLMIGVALVQMPAKSESAATAAPKSEEHHSMSSQLVGLLAVISACVTSGFSGVTFFALFCEKASIWRN